MPKSILALCLSVLLLSAMLLSLPLQTVESQPTILTPGAPLSTPTATPELPGGCYSPLPLSIGEAAFIKPGVNIRNIPNESGALVWNTIYENLDEEGRVIDNPLAVPVTIQEGPVCDQGYNWWRVTGTGNPGWVAEGRPDEGYWILYSGAATSASCENPYDFAIGQQVDLQYNARVREAPTRQGLTRTVAPFGTPVSILGGPQCVESLLWWYVRVTVVNAVYEGWMAATNEDVDLLLPPDLPSLEDGTLCANPLSFAPGDRGYVTYRSGPPKSLRAAPGTDSEFLFSLVRNVPFIIEDGPVCRENLNWWKIRVLASSPVVGWMAEGSPGIGYWIVREIRR